MPSHQQKQPRPDDLVQRTQSHPTSRPDGPCVDTQTLFQGHSIVELNHAGQRYLLRLTRENKLILTK